MNLKKHYARRQEGFSYGKFLLIVFVISFFMALIKAGAAIAFIYLATLVTIKWLQISCLAIAVLLAIFALEELFTVPGILFQDLASGFAERYLHDDSNPQ